MPMWNAASRNEWQMPLQWRGVEMGVNPFQLGFESRLLKFLPVSESDLELLFSWRTHPEISRYLYADPPTDMQQQKAWFQAMQQNSTDIYYLVLKRETSPVPVGYCQLSQLDWEAHCAESGVVVGNPQYWKSGIALKMALFLFKIAFSFLHVQSIFSSVHPDNRASCRYFEDIVGSQRIEGDHPYRKPTEVLFHSTPALFSQVEARFQSKGSHWSQLFQIEPILPRLEGP